MDFKKLNAQRIAKPSVDTTPPPPQPRGMTNYQKEVILKSINELHEKVSNAHETTTRLERELPKARKDLALAEAGVAQSATSITRGRLNRIREQLSEKELAIKGTESSIDTWEEQIAAKKKILVDDRRLNGERSASDTPVPGTPVPMKRTEREGSIAPALKKTEPKITRRKVKVPIGPSMERVAERQAEEIVRRRAVRERDLEESKAAAAREAALEHPGRGETVETAPVAQMTAEPETDPSCSKRKREGEGNAAQKKAKLNSKEPGSSETSEGSEISRRVPARPETHDAATADSMRASGKMYVYHPKRRTFGWHSIGANDNILGLAQTRSASSSRSTAVSTASAVDPATPARERESDDDYELHGLVNTKLSCFSNGVLQVLGAALSYEQIEQLRGEGDLMTFGLKHDDFLMLKTDADGKMKRPDRDNLELLRSKISIHAANNGEIDIAPYLGQVLLDLREGISHKSKMPSNKHVASACLMQQVFAYGAEDGVRSVYDGDSQQDARLYLGALIDAAGTEHSFIQEIFQRSTAVKLECAECTHKSEHRETDIILDASLPVEDAVDGEVLLRDLPELQKVQTERLSDHKCEGCGELEVTVKTTTIEKLPKYWLVHLKRARPDDKKIKTKIGLAYDSAVVQQAQDEYVLRCVLRHIGRSSSKGHYDVVREHCGKWVTIDDQVMTGAKDADIEDNSRRQSAMVLLRKVEG